MITNSSIYSSTTLSKRQVVQLVRAFVFDRRGNDTIPRAPHEFLGCAESEKEKQKDVRQQAKHKPQPLAGISDTYKKSFWSCVFCCCRAFPPQTVAGATNVRQNSAFAAVSGLPPAVTKEVLPSQAKPLTKKSFTSCDSDSSTLAARQVYSRSKEVR